VQTPHQAARQQRSNYCSGTAGQATFNSRLHLHKTNQLLVSFFNRAHLFDQTAVQQQQCTGALFCPDFCLVFWTVATCSTKHPHDFGLRRPCPFIPIRRDRYPFTDARLSDKCFSDLGDDSSSASTTAPSSPTSHHPCLLLGVRRIDYFRYDTETMTWTEDPGFDYLLDIVDFRHIRSAPATTFVPIL
jgi:hypothetical protein